MASHDGGSGRGRRPQRGQKQPAKSWRYRNAIFHDSCIRLSRPAEGAEPGRNGSSTRSLAWGWQLAGSRRCDAAGPAKCTSRPSCRPVLTCIHPPVAVSRCDARQGCSAWQRSQRHCWPAVVPESRLNGSAAAAVRRACQPGCLGVPAPLPGASIGPLYGGCICTHLVGRLLTGELSRA